MDQLMVDVGDEPVEAGDEVVLIGARVTPRSPPPNGPTVLGTISYEIVTGIGARVPRTVPRMNEYRRFGHAMIGLPTSARG